MINKPFKCGDLIAVNGSVDATGIVDEIDLMYTKMHTGDNKTVTSAKRSYVSFGF